MRWAVRHQEKIFPLLDIALNGLNYVFNIYVAWHLVPADFGVMTALLAVLSLLLVTGVSLQLYTAKHVAEQPSQALAAAMAAKGIRRSALMLIGAVSALFLVGAVWLHALTRGSFGALALVLVVFLLNAFLSIDRGILQGSRRFLQLNLNFYIEVGVKVVALWALFHVDAAIEPVLLAIALGMAAALVHARWVTSTRIQGSVDADVAESVTMQRTHLSRIAKIYAATFFTYFFTSADLIIVNFYLPDQSGYFAVALKYTQILLFASLSLATVFLPLLSSAKDDAHLFARRLRLLLGLVAVLIAAVSAAYWVAAGPTVDWFFGHQYAPATQFILLDCLPYALLILNFVAINLQVVFDHSRYLWVLFGGAALLVGLLLAFHSSLTSMLLIESAVFAAMLAGQLVLLRHQLSWAVAARRDPASGSNSVAAVPG